MGDRICMVIVGRVGDGDCGIRASFWSSVLLFVFFFSVLVCRGRFGFRGECRGRFGFLFSFVGLGWGSVLGPRLFVGCELRGVDPGVPMDWLRFPAAAG